MATAPNPWESTAASATTPAAADVALARRLLDELRVDAAKLEAKLEERRGEVEAKAETLRRMAAAAKRPKGATAAATTTTTTKMRRGVLSPPDLDAFLGSATAADIVGFVSALNESVKTTRIETDVAPDANASRVLAALDALAKLLADTPLETSAPHSTSSSGASERERFGNRAFRTWHAKVEGAIQGALLGVLPATASTADAVDELATYWMHAFGDPIRLDYGTGHEAAFVMSMLVMWKRAIVSDLAQLALVVFPAYLALARAARKKYRLEPAGSHGVWSLDDYHFLPFVFGSAQLTWRGPGEGATPRAVLRSPASVVSGALLGNGPSNMLVEALRDVLESKTGPFNEHSPMLHELGGMKSWEDVNAGLLRMWRGEVLNKFPVAQHFWFGPSLPVLWAPVGGGGVGARPPPGVMLDLGFDPLAKYFFRSSAAAPPRGAVAPPRLVVPAAAPPPPSSAQQTTVVESEDGRALTYQLLDNGASINVVSDGWHLSAVTDAKISNESELDEIRAKAGVDIPLPEMTFGQNYFSAKHGPSGVEFRFEMDVEVLRGMMLRAAGEASDRTLVKVPMADKWAQRVDADGNPIKTWREDYDWTFTTPYGGRFFRGEGGVVEPQPTARRIDYERLKRREPILWSKSVVLFEDDLFDMGMSKLSLRVRVMPSCFFVLARVFVRVDRTFLRAFDTRVYHVFGTSFVLVETSKRESAYVEATHAQFKADDADALVQALPLLGEPVTREVTLS